MSRRYGFAVLVSDRDIEFAWARDRAQARVTSAVWRTVARAIDDPELADVAMKKARGTWIDCPNDPWTRYQLEVLV